MYNLCIMRVQNEGKQGFQQILVLKTGRFDLLDMYCDPIRIRRAEDPLCRQQKRNAA